MSSRTKEHSLFWLVESEIIYFDFKILPELVLPKYHDFFSGIKKYFQKNFNNNSSVFLNL